MPKTKAKDSKIDKAAKKSPANPETIADQAPAAAPGTSSASKVTRRLLDKHPPLPKPLRVALRSLATDAQRSDLGRQTKAVGVLADGVTMAVTIDQHFATFPYLTETYAPQRFVYLLESLLALDALVEASSAREAKLGAARGVATTGYEIAANARRKLLRRLERFAGKRDAERQALNDLPRQGRGNDALREATEKAVTLAREWLRRSDPVQVALAELAGLDQAVIEIAEQAAAALDAAHVDATLEGRKSSHDSPIVNLEEGNVLLEMAYAIDIFDEAHDDNDVVPRLVPGPATRHVLASSPRRAPADAAPEPVAAATPPAG
ncbi:MAG: hypothetical protein ABJE95_24660 [Byssovorax sp.]